jgi:prephenate dehydratase
MFWIDFEGELDNEWVKYAMNELKYYTTEINIL